VSDATVAGAFVVPSLTSYDVAPVVFQLRYSDVPVPIVPLGGFGESAAGGPSGGGVPEVLNDHTGPSVAPPLFFATICQ
jgi:hypothetical protein